MRAVAFCAWFVPLFLLYIVLVFGYNAVKIQHRAAAQRKARQEQERIAAERRAKDEARKREQQAEKARKAAETAKVKAAKEEERRQKAAEKARKAAEAAKTQRAQAIPESALPSGAQPFAGEIVAFTGENPKMTHRHMIEHVNRLGGKGYDDVYVRTTLLVVGEKPGKGKLDKAARYNIPTITWEEWWERAFGFPAFVKPEPEAEAQPNAETRPEAQARPEKEEESTLTLEQFAAIAGHAA